MAVTRFYLYTVYRIRKQILYYHIIIDLSLPEQHTELPGQLIPRQFHH